jgi:ABC-type uncharacterized transport system involved in gliding motility auxiliary subunit
MKKILPWITGFNLIVVVILVNIFLSFYPGFKIDLTKDKVWILSPVTKKTISQLDDMVTVKVFLTVDLPAEIKPVAVSLKATLEEFSRLNRKNFKVLYLDPSKDDAAKTEATNLGIRPIQFSSIKTDKFEVQSGYFGLSINYGDKREVLPIAGDVGNLEYFLISGIKKLKSEKIPTIALADASETETTSQIKILRRLLSQNYSLIPAVLDGETPLPKEADSLLIVDRRNKIDEKGIAKINDWINSGKGLIAFISKVAVDQNMHAGKIEDTGLGGIFRDNGLEIEQKLVVDPMSTIANFKTQEGSFLVQYNYWPQIRPENIDHSLPVMSGINSLMLPWPSPIKISGEAKTLFYSSNFAFVDEVFTDLSPTKKTTINPSETKRYPLAGVNLNGKKLALIGTSEIIKDVFGVNNQQNFALALNLADFFSQDSSLLAVRNKALKNNPITVVNDQTKTLIRVISIFIPIFILLITAIIFKVIRNKKNHNWNEEK